MNETTKAQRRRQWQVEHGRRWFNWHAIFAGEVLDVGPGGDPLDKTPWPQVESVYLFDKEQGDANKIDEYFPEEKFRCIHGSQVLEHLHNPADFIRRAFKILRPGGWICMTVPDLDLYEKRQFPSRYNSDHKTTWSLWRHSRPAYQGVHSQAPHIFVPHWIQQFDVAERRATLIDTNYDYLLPDEIDQSLDPEKEVEMWIEIMLKKK